MSITLDPALLEALKSLAAKLGTTIDTLLSLMKAQVLANSIVNMAWGVVLSVYIVFAIVLYAKTWKLSGDDFDLDRADLATFCLGLAIVAFIVGGFLFTRCAMFQMNPDYYALKLLFETLK